MSISNGSDLQVITAAKDLCSYTMHATQKSPKAFRFSYVSRLQELALSVIEHLYLANDIFIGQAGARPTAANVNARLQHQRLALARLKLLAYMAMNALEQGCLTAKQFEQISLKSANCQNLLGGWMVSDSRRYAR